MDQSLIGRLAEAWMNESASPVSLPDLPLLDAVDGVACGEIRDRVQRTIAECEREARRLECQLQQRRFIVAFLRDFVDRCYSSGSSQLLPLAAGSTSHMARPVAPTPPRRRRRTPQNTPLAASDQQLQQHDSPLVSTRHIST